MFDDSLRVRENAIAQADAHSGPEWRSQASAWLRGYLEDHAFLRPDDARHNGCPAPPDDEWRALGSVVRAAARDGWMEKAGYAPRASGHRTPSPVWRSLLYREAVA